MNGRSTYGIAQVRAAAKPERFVILRATVPAKHAQHFDVAGTGGELNRGFAFLSGSAHVGAVVEQLLHYLRVSRLRREVQCGASVLHRHKFMPAIVLPDICYIQ
jgi:hypothetical protein